MASLDSYRETVCNGEATTASDDTARRDEGENDLKSCVTRLLEQRRFRGSYEQKDWIEHVGEYRDLIVVDDRKFASLVESFKYVGKKLNDYYNGSKWIGLSDSNCAGFCLWLELRNAGPHVRGERNFCIQGLEFADREVRLIVNEVASFSDDDVSETTSVGERSVNDGECYGLSVSGSAAETFDPMTVFYVTVMRDAAFSISEWLLKFMDKLIELVHAVAPIFVALCTLLFDVVRLFANIYMWQKERELRMAKEQESERRYKELQESERRYKQLQESERRYKQLQERINSDQKKIKKLEGMINRNWYYRGLSWYNDGGGSDKQSAIFIAFLIFIVAIKLKIESYEHM